jgi:magnesium-transporting ATPase (P-type)
MKEKNYKLRSKVYKATGFSTIGVTTLGSFFAYQSYTNWESFQTEINNFVLIQENTMKLNLTIALPVLVSMIVYLWVMLRKNREFFKDKISINLTITILVLYLVYSVIEVTMVSLIGALAGSFVDEFVFMPLSNGANELAKEQHEIDNEYKKEAVRIKARKKAQEDINGTV